MPAEPNHLPPRFVRVLGDARQLPEKLTIELKEVTLCNVAAGWQNCEAVL